MTFPLEGAAWGKQTQRRVKGGCAFADWDSSSALGAERVRVYLGQAVHTCVWVLVG